MTSICLTSVSIDQSNVKLAQNTLAKYGPSTKELSASVVVVFLSVSHIIMMVGCLWWLVLPAYRILTLFHASLGLKLMECIF